MPNHLGHVPVLLELLARKLSLLNQSQNKQQDDEPDESLQHLTLRVVELRGKQTDDVLLVCCERGKDHREWVEGQRCLLQDRLLVGALVEASFAFQTTVAGVTNASKWQLCIEHLQRDLVAGECAGRGLLDK